MGRFQAPVGPGRVPLPVLQLLASAQGRLGCTHPNATAAASLLLAPCKPSATASQLMAQCAPRPVTGSSTCSRRGWWCACGARAACSALSSANASPILPMVLVGPGWPPRRPDQLWAAVHLLAGVGLFWRQRLPVLVSRVECTAAAASAARRQSAAQPACGVLAVCRSCLPYRAHHHRRRPHNRCYRWCGRQPCTAVA